jgi:hypothetical protein
VRGDSTFCSSPQPLKVVEEAPLDVSLQPALDTWAPASAAWMTRHRELAADRVNQKITKLTNGPLPVTSRCPARKRASDTTTHDARQQQEPPRGFPKFPGLECGRRLRKEAREGDAGDGAT